MSSEERPATGGAGTSADAGPGGEESRGPGGEESRGPGGEESRGPDGAGERRTLPEPSDRRKRQYQVNDPAVMRALAHPLRWALLEALTHAGTLTATQAGDMLGETPANCAFHLRTLARYGLVEEAGGGKGRERPWRRTTPGFTMELASEDPKTAAAAGVLNDFWVNATMDRARAAMLSLPGWPAEWRKVMGSAQSLRYVTLAEAEELQAELLAVVDRFGERNDDPSTRPPDALPVEYLLLAYPLRDLIGKLTPPPGPPDSSG